jgi:hypothetical protein
MAVRRFCPTGLRLGGLALVQQAALLDGPRSAEGNVGRGEIAR